MILPLLAAGGVTAVATQTSAHAGPDPDRSLPSLASAAATTTPSGTSGAAPGRVVSGVVEWKARTLPTGSVAHFSLRGAERLTKTDRSAPYVFVVDTRQLPDGGYTLAIKTWREGEKARTSRSRVTIANKKPGSGQPTGEASTTPSTTTTTKTASPTTTRTRTTPPTRPTTTTTKPVPPASPTTTTQPPATSGYAAQVVQLTNAERARNGCPALQVDATLTKVAQAHSADMAAQSYFSHTSKDGRSPFDRMSQAGYRYSRAAENIAAGYGTPSAVVQGWMNSPGHRRNILDCALQEIGVGYVKTSTSAYGTYWTQNFGTER